MLSFNKVVLLLSGLCFAVGIVLSIPLLFEQQREGHAAAVQLDNLFPSAVPLPFEQQREGHAAAVQLDNLFSSVVKEVKPAVVVIYAKKVQKKKKEEARTASNEALQSSVDFGSGFLINPQGFILTNYHLVEGAGVLEVTLADGRTTPGRTVRSSPHDDISLVKIEMTEELPAVRLGDSDGLEAGHRIFSIGHPSKLRNTVSTGAIQALGRSGLSLLRHENFIQHGATISPGSSGGPLVNVRGEVVGINTAVKLADHETSRAVSFAVPINLARALANRWIEGGDISWLGISTMTVDQDMADYCKLSEPNGVFIQLVRRESPAEKAGLRIKDIMVEFNGRKIRDRHDLHLMIAEQVPGEPVLVVVIRAGQKRTFTIVPKEKPGSSHSPAPLVLSDAEETRVFGWFGVKTETLRLPLVGSPSKLIATNDKRRTGVEIVGVKPDSVAERKGLSRGDVILEVNSREVENKAEFDDAISATGDVTMIKVLKVSGSGRRRYTHKRFYFIRPRQSAAAGRLEHAWLRCLRIAVPSFRIREGTEDNQSSAR